MSDESNDYGFGSFVRHDEPTMQAPAPIAAQKPVGTSVKERKLSNPTNAAQTATTLAKEVGPARAAEITPITQDPGFQKDAAAVGLTSLGLGAIGLASIFGAGYYMGKKGKSSAPVTERKEPFFETTQNISDLVTNPVKEAPPMSAPKGAELAEAGARNTMQNAVNQQLTELQKAGAVAPTAPVAGPTPVAPYDQGRMANMMAAQEMVNPLGGQASAYTEPLRPAQSVEPPKNKGGRPSKASTEALLKEGVFKEGFGGADNWMQSQVGHDIRRFIKDEFNAGKPYGSGQAAMDKAYSDIGKYEQWLKENIPVQTLNKAERKAVGVPSPAPYGPLGKAIKVGGTAGLLMSAINAANAKQAAQNVGEALLPIGMTPSELAPGTLYTPQQQREFTRQLEAQRAAERQKLGSPYRSVPPPR